MHGDLGLNDVADELDSAVAETFRDKEGIILNSLNIKEKLWKTRNTALAVR